MIGSSIARSRHVQLKFQRNMKYQCQEEHTVLCLADLAVGVLMFLASHCDHVKQGSRSHNIVGRAAEDWILAADILSVAVRQARLRHSRRQGVQDTELK